MKRIEVCQGAHKQGARTKRGLVLAIRRCTQAPIVRGSADALIEFGAYVAGAAGNDPMRPIIEFAPGEYVQCEVQS